MCGPLQDADVPPEEEVWGSVEDFATYRGPTETHAMLAVHIACEVPVVVAQLRARLDHLFGEESDPTTQTRA